MTLDPRLARLLGGDALAALRRRLRRHYERGGTADAQLQLADLQPAERDALAQLSGRPVRNARSLRLDLAALDTALQRAGIAASLHDALVQLDGPITDRTAERATAQAAWERLQAQPPVASRLLQDWLAAPAALGLLRRLSRQDSAGAATLLNQADAVLQQLPAAGQPRAQLAARILGDAHALDEGRPVATLVLAAWRQTQAPPDGPQAPEHREADAEEALPDPDTPEDHDSAAPAPERRRDLWASAGVLVNELARPVLLLNLPTPPDGALPLWRPGEPAYLSLRWLLREQPAWPVAGRSVYVCENPNLLAIAADRLGPRCAPLVCSDGMPAAAQRTLLQQLARCGAQLRCHADFDWAGLRIASQLLSHPGATPWRMGAADYLSALSDACTDLAGPRLKLNGPVVQAPWDAQLTPAMQHHAVALAEEALADSLMADLAGCRRREQHG